MARKMKDSGVEWVKQIPEEWQISSNSHLFSFEKKIVGNEWAKIQLLSLTKKGIVTKNINDGSGKQPESFSTYQQVHKKQLVMCLFDLDVSAVFSGVSNYDGMISPAYKVFSINQSLLYPKYIDYYFQAIFINRNYVMYSKSLRKTIDTDNFMSIKTIVPPLSEQQKIADFLDEKVKEIDNAIEKTKETIELYEKMKKAVIEDFVFKRKEKNAIDTGIYYIKKIPTYWGITKVKYVLDENGLKTKTGLEEPLSVSQKYGLIPTKNMDSVPLQMADYSKCKIVHKNDLVFNKLKAHLGVFYHSDYEGIVSPDYAVYQSLNINVEYLELLFKTKEYISEFIKRSTGVGQGFMRLYTEPLFSMYIPYPSIKEQKEIVNSIRQKHEEIDNLINYKEKIVNDLTCYKKSLIYEYVTGKKEVK
ncbi:restriction endonuclease subunit S [Streptococcus alactolyticus]|uniref:restriction endonuclease subunit S n=1 Tax=Streptococcus alactolyticus TaxID=29389 RepID=UPI003F98496A